MTRGVQGGAIRSAAVDVCLVALARGPLIRDGHQWRFGRRCFSNTTIKRLINEGEAVRIGDVVRAAVRPAIRFPPVRIDEGWSLRKRAYETNLLAAAEWREAVLPWLRLIKPPPALVNSPQGGHGRRLRQLIAAGGLDLERVILMVSCPRRAGQPGGRGRHPGGWCDWGPAGTAPSRQRKARPVSGKRRASD
jgi:hypothetical protein